MYVNGDNDVKLDAVAAQGVVRMSLILLAVQSAREYKGPRREQNTQPRT